MGKEITPREASQRLARGALLIDVREDHERELGMAEGAVGVARDELADTPGRSRQPAALGDRRHCVAWRADCAGWLGQCELRGAVVWRRQLVVRQFPQVRGPGFTLWRGIGVDYEGGVLDGASRIAIQMAHRVFAVIVASYLVALAVRLLRTPGMRYWAVWLLLLLASQVTLGILNVKLALPLPVAVLHNAGAVGLLFVLVSLLARLRMPDQAIPEPSAIE